MPVARPHDTLRAVEALRERFGKYHVLEKIAQGGMAEVYKVKTVGIAGFEKIQALKRILPHSAREGRFIRSFIDEARIAVELTHRNIVQVFDFGKADGELFLAMELIEGRDLRTAMAAGVVARSAVPDRRWPRTSSPRSPPGSTTRTARPTATAARSASCTATCRRRT